MRHTQLREWRSFYGFMLLAQELFCHVLGGTAAVAHGEDYCGSALSITALLDYKKGIDIRMIWHIFLQF